MQIFIFTTTHSDGDITISQVYAKNRIWAMVHLELIYGDKESGIEYIGDEETCRPLSWDDISNSISLTN